MECYFSYLWQYKIQIQKEKWGFVSGTIINQWYYEKAKMIFNKSLIHLLIK